MFAYVNTLSKLCTLPHCTYTPIYTCKEKNSSFLWNITFLATYISFSNLPVLAFVFHFHIFFPNSIVISHNILGPRKVTGDLKYIFRKIIKICPFSNTYQNPSVTWQQHELSMTQQLSIKITSTPQAHSQFTLITIIKDHLLQTWVLKIIVHRPSVIFVYMNICGTFAIFIKKEYVCLIYRWRNMFLF